MRKLVLWIRSHGWPLTTATIGLLASIVTIAAFLRPSDDNKEIKVTLGQTESVFNNSHEDTISMIYDSCEIATKRSINYWIDNHHYGSINLLKSTSFISDMKNDQPDINWRYIEENIWNLIDRVDKRVSYSMEIMGIDANIEASKAYADGSIPHLKSTFDERIANFEKQKGELHDDIELATDAVKEILPETCDIISESLARIKGM